jgi:hypothetical protein
VLGSGNHIFITGGTCSTDFPISSIFPPFQSTKSSHFYFNAYVSELDPNQTATAAQLIYSTYLGGSGSDAGTAIAVDGSGKIYVAGSASSSDFPVVNTCSRLQKLNGPSDAFVTVLDPGMPPSSQLTFSTFLGGTGSEGASALARGSAGNLYLGGGTTSGDFPVTRNAFQFGNNAFAAGRGNAFVTELDPSSNVCPTPFASPKLTATPKATPTTARTPRPTPTKTPIRPTASPVPTPSGPPHIASIPSIILVGGSFNIAGANFTKGSVVNFFVATGGGPIKAGVFTPRVHTPTLLTVDVPAGTTLGQGFTSVQVINTDAGFTVSNTAFALLQGAAAAGIPTTLLP